MISKACWNSSGADPYATHSSRDLAKSLSRDTAKEYLRRLKKKEVVVREGTTRTGRWVVTDTGKANLFDE